MKIPLLITAGFGEIRPNHFHSGLDFSTQGRSQDVLASASGYISRVKVSLRGYGNALYMDHPEGYTTVYGHLSEFSAPLQEYVLKMQRESKDYEIDVLVDSARFNFKQGEVIGKSGNSGSSTAPHLHFEIRDKIIENVFNPLLFGFGDDKTAPAPTSLLIFPKEDYGKVNNSSSYLRLPLYRNSKTGLRSTSSKIPKPKLSGWVGFGFEGGDVIGKPGNYSGMYQVRVLVDELEVFESRMDEFSFDESRSVNCWIDYKEKKRANKKYQRCVVPANPLIGIYKASIDQGYFHFNENRDYKITWEFTDVAGNKTTQSLDVQGSLPNTSFSSSKVPVNHQRIFPDGAVIKYEDQMKVIISKRSLYDTADVKFIPHPQPGKYSPLVEVGSVYLPLHSGMNLKFKPENYPQHIKDKLCIAEKTRGSYDVLSTSWDGEWLSANYKYFGDFEVIADTIAPEIVYLPRKTKNPKTKRLEAQSVADAGYIKIRVTDPVSESFSWQAYLDGEWVLMFPASGKNTWYLNVDKNLSLGEHTFQVKASDEYNNESSFTLPFSIP
ncbi:MAG: M23 family metallopeptidase [Bacteroidia bacterium]